MDAFDLNKVIAQQKESGNRYLEFLRVPSMSLGVYTLPAGGKDTQQPHTEDEIYYVAHGRATIRVGAEDQPVEPGSVVFVAAHVEHRFHSITEELTVLVFFAPSEYTYKGD
jgi:mannose-6-phosphate isomerase-like protein (cupin superfamily)